MSKPVLVVNPNSNRMELVYDYTRVSIHPSFTSGILELRIHSGNDVIIAGRYESVERALGVARELANGVFPSGVFEIPAE